MQRAKLLCTRFIDTLDDKIQKSHCFATLDQIRGVQGKNENHDMMTKFKIQFDIFYLALRYISHITTRPPYISEMPGVQATYDMYVQNSKAHIMKRSGMDVDLTSSKQSIPLYSVSNMSVCPSVRPSVLCTLYTLSCLSAHPPTRPFNRLSTTL